MKNMLRRIWGLTKLGLMLLGALVLLHATVLVIHNATNKPSPPPGGWYPPQPGDENYEESKHK